CLDISLVIDNASTDLGVHVLKMGRLSWLRLKFIVRRSAWRPERVVLQKRVSVKKMDLLYGRLGDEIQHVRSRSTQSHNRNLSQLKLFCDEIDFGPARRGIDIVEDGFLFFFPGSITGKGFCVTVESIIWG